MIDMWTVSYRDPRTGGPETVTVYSFPSGGVSIAASDPDLAAILSPGLGTIVGFDVPPGEAEKLAARLADMVSHLTGGATEHHPINQYSDV